MKQRMVIAVASAADIEIAHQMLWNLQVRNPDRPKRFDLPKTGRTPMATLASSLIFVFGYPIYLHFVTASDLCLSRLFLGRKAGDLIVA